MADRLATYRAKRDFTRTPEPGGTPAATGGALRYVVQRHDARRLHHDFRLEWRGVLLSWAVPKGPSPDPADKRMAVRTEDHPLAYAGFEGTIPQGEYGAGEVVLWDQGHWQPEGDVDAGLAQGKLGFTLHGQRLAGRWELVRLRPARAPRETWLLIKRRDAPARAEALPDTLAPQLAQLAEGLPGPGRWIFETKFDGYRLLARVQGDEVRLVTRNGHDWTARLPELRDAVAALGVDGAWLDGEIVAPGGFNALQNAFDRRRSAALEYVLFDIPFLEGRDLRDTPLAQRRGLLARLLQARPTPRLRFSEALAEGGAAEAPALLAAACRAGAEGVLAKRADAPYRSAREALWLKLKCQARQEFVIGGYTPRSDDAGAVGSLVLGVHDATGRLVHAGSVGTGWDRRTAAALRRRLQPLEAGEPPFADGAPAAGRWNRRAVGHIRWVQPRLVAEVTFGEWTPAGHIRHASFVGLRSDKPADTIVRERPRDMDHPDLRLTHPERVIDAQSKATKLELAQYLAGMAEFLLPQLAGRPVALVRAPGGVGEATFFQKHDERTTIPGITVLDPKRWPGHEALLQIDGVDALLAAAQMNVIEFHTWNARSRSLARPDRMVFDLDPGEGVAWPQVQEGALLVRALLDELGLPNGLKTSGGKGLHVVVPIAPRRGFDEVKGFSQAVVRHLAQTIPQRFVAKSGPKNRVGRIFVDYLRNGEGATTVAAFSPRARPGLGVSMPVAWDELPRLTGGAHWTIRNAREHLRQRPADPWAGLGTDAPTLTAAMKALGWKPPRRPAAGS